MVNNALGQINAHAATFTELLGAIPCAIQDAVRNSGENRSCMGKAP